MASTSTSENSIQELPKYNDSIYKFHIPSHIPLGNHKAEVIFFHDIQWTGCKEPHVQSWMSSTEPQVCWPKAWLPVRYPEARILSARYDAGKWKGKSTGHMQLHLLAENLRQDILSIYVESCPVFLVGHGLGGLVIKALIREVQQKRHDFARHGSRYEELVRKSDRFLENVKGILYYATPFLGTKLADLGKDSPHRGSMWIHLEVLSTQTCHLNEWFRDWRSTTNCKATSILVVLPTEVPLWYGDWCTLVVEEAAARYDVDIVYSSQTNHFNVCKLRDETDSSFRRLIDVMDPDIQAAIHDPVAQVQDSDKSLCTNYVTEILSKLENLTPGDGLCLNTEITQKIGDFPEVWEDLEHTLRKAGLAKTDENADAESWEPVHRELREELPNCKAIQYN